MAFPTGWGYKQKLTIQNSLVSATLTDFPVLVTRTELHNDVVDPSGSNNAQSDGGDIRFSSDAAGVTQLPCEVVTFAHDTTTGAGDAVIQMWVKIPSVSSTVDTDFYIWYKTTGTDSQPAVTDTYGRNNVWDSNFKVVLHLEEAVNTTADGYIDSSGNGNHGTGVSMALSEAAVQIGDGQEFDGSADYIQRTAAAPVTAYPCTLSGWFDSDSIAANQTIVSVADTSAASGFFLRAMGAIAGDPIRATSGGGTNVSTTASYSANTKHYAVATFESTSNVDVYLDGGNNVSGTGGATTGLDNYTVGNLKWNGTAITHPFDGHLDEIRISDSVRSADWIYAEYNNQSSPSTFIIDSAPTAAGATAALTGTATASITEADIVTGGKTIILTLTGDTFVTGTTSEDGIAAGSDSDQAEANGWDALVKTDLDNTDVVLSGGNTIATITLPAYATYDITAQETITWTIPAASLTTSSSPIVATPTFTIDAVAAGTTVVKLAGHGGLAGLGGLAGRHGGMAG